MAKFRSQKHIYDDIYMREQEYHVSDEDDDNDR